MKQANYFEYKQGWFNKQYFDWNGEEQKQLPPLNENYNPAKAYNARKAMAESIRNYQLQNKRNDEKEN